MFYAHFVLSKKGPLARIWLAAHWDKKLTKAHVFETSIEGSVEAIIKPKVKLALRTSGHLLLGVVRIYSRKAKYLLADCNEAFVKIKMAFRPGVVDLPEENREAAVATITLPETFHDFDTTMADLTEIDVQAQFAVNQSRPEEITMREDLGNITLVGDDGFDDMGFDGGAANIIQDAHMDDTLYVKNPDTNLLLDNKDSAEKPMDIDLEAQPREDGFGDGIADFEGPAGVEDDDSDNEDNFGGGVDHDLFGENFVGEAGGLFEEPPVPEVPLQQDAEAQQQHKEGVDKDKERPLEEEAAPALPEQTTVPDQTTLLPNEAEAFALEPIDVTSLGTERKAKRKRKLVIDDHKGIPSETMKVQLSDTSDIVTTLDLAPPTKKLMHWKETGGVEKLFALPGRPTVSKRTTRLFNKNLVTQPMKEETAADEITNLELENEQEVAPPTIPEPEEPERAREADDSRLGGGDDLGAAQPEQPSVLEPPSLLEPGRPSLAESSTLTAVGADDTLQQPPTPLTRSRLQKQQQPQQPEEEPAEDEDVGPPPIMRESDEEEDVQDADEIFEDLPEDLDEHLSPAVEGEEGEDMEEKRWTKRTQQMMHILDRHLQRTATASFKELTSRNNRKQVASKFYTLLVLKKAQSIEVEQAQPYGDIAIIQGPKWELAF